jgi:uncharacterized membrane protein YgcG
MSRAAPLLRPIASVAVVGTLFVALVAALLSPVAAIAAGPPFPDPVGQQLVYDDADVLLPATRLHLESMTDSIRTSEDLDVVVYTQRRDSGTAAPDLDSATSAAEALVAQWDVDMAFVADLTGDGELGSVGVAVGPAMARSVDADDLETIRADVAEWLASDDLDTALIVGVSDVLFEVWGPVEAEGEEGPGLPGVAAIDPGPPFPDPVDRQAVYDFAGIFSSEAIVEAERVIDEIEARTAAEVVVYSQLVDWGVTTDETERRARALIDQWGVGRAGFDDGLAIFFDIEPSLVNGEVQLYAAPGFEATYLTNSDRQSIFEDDMLPFLRNEDFDGALGVALERVNAAATPENAARLEAGRQVNAVLGLIGAPIVFMGLAGWAFMSWRRFGKDPVYLDDPSILMPAPPPDLTAASGAFVMDGGTSRRALTTAMLDLASRGLIAFREEKGLLGLSTKVGIDTQPAAGDAIEEAQRARNARRPTGPAEAVALNRLRGMDRTEHYIEPDELPKFGTSVPAFDTALEQHVVAKGWMVERPSKVVGRWTGRGVLAMVAGAIALFAGFTVPISGLVLIGIAAIAGGVVVVMFAQGMPSVTMPGAMVRAMLHAYRRTLQKTMEQARSMQQVVDEAGMEWLETPDQAVVWGTALGLQGEIEEVLKRSLDDVEDGRVAASATYFPGWYQTSSGQSFASAAAAGSGGSIFSGSAVPDIGGMMSALGTIGNSPSSSGSGGGGGFSGGSSGGGGGGAGGGF